MTIPDDWRHRRWVWSDVQGAMELLTDDQRLRALEGGALELTEEQLKECMRKGYLEDKGAVVGGFDSFVADFRARMRHFTPPSVPPDASALHWKPPPSKSALHRDVCHGIEHEGFGYYFRSYTSPEYSGADLLDPELAELWRALCYLAHRIEQHVGYEPG